MNENYEDYETNIDTSEYEEDVDNSSRNKKILLIILVLVGIIIIILLLRSCGREGTGKFDYEKTLLQAGKEYFEYNGNEKPIAKSSCEIVTLDKLTSEGLLNPDNYEDCDGEKTYVKVCLLENGKEHYVPLLKCDNINSDNLYESFKEGKISDIIADQTDIKFSYLGEVLKSEGAETGSNTEVWYGDKIPYENYKLISKVTYYRYQDLQYRWYESSRLYYPNNTISGGRELYISVPSNSYDKKANEQTGYKWYKITQNGTKEYYPSNDKKEYYVSAPDGYPEKDTSDVYVTRSKTRTYTVEGNAILAYQMYTCIETEYKDKIGIDPNAIATNEFYPCGDSRNTENPGHDYTLATFYSYDGGVSKVAQGTIGCSKGELFSDNETCVTYNSWVYSSNNCTDPNTNVCQNFAPIYSYRWYKIVGGTGEVKTYYPSGSSTAAGEKTYYAQSPEAGYVKDEGTKATVWNWYKDASSITAGYFTTAPSEGATQSSESKWTSWTEWSSTPVQSLGSAGTRKIETKVKLTIQEIKNVSKDGYEKIMTKYTEDIDELIAAFKAKGYEVESLSDIAMNGELKYQVKMYIRNKK